MTKLITSLIVVLLGANLNYAQVGIGTETPQAMLDVAGTVLVQGETTLQQPLKLEYIHSEAVTQLTGNEIVLIADLNDQNIVKEVSLQNLSNGLGTYDLNRPNTSIYAAKKTSGFTLLSIGLLVAGFRPIDFTNANRTIGNQALFSDTTHAYTVPSSGVYEIDFDFKMGTGLQASLLTGNPGIGIVRTRGGSSILLDSKSFSGLGALLNITITDTKMNFVYSLQQDDQLTFGMTNSSVITLSLLTSSIASFHIRKIAGSPQ
ncbi:hypothetical protein [Moheibacter sediminis]|uniref:C1q domain-containing protein n=1 Tax=Moheibacter sediminis TaxID=1434700 RepID=A0A1W2BZL3_9FLAO|nr:hypothetical protein [Moheibacter sediminis]SMC78194.1 hypothetical protein SAMN06296427_1086 [Moheibacter sediminis]